MSRRTAIFLAALGVAAVAGCYTGPAADLSPAIHGPQAASDGAEPLPDGERADDAGAGAPSGLPCDVAKVLATSCTDCHGDKLRGGAPNALVTYEDLTAPSKSDPSKSVAEVSVERMTAAKRPMPPEGAAAPEDIAVLVKWIGAGLPRGTCGSKPPVNAADGGSEGGGGPNDAAADAPVVCTSGVTWPAGAPASPLMHPGKKCIACHSATGGPAHTFAGTVYPTAHEPNDCNGSSKPGLSVLLIDAAGKTHTMAVNAAGNFYRVTSMPMPYRAMIVDGTKVREMKTPQTDGDCNGCHSQQAGRVLAP